MAFEHFQKMGVDLFRSEYVRTRGFYGQPEFQHFAPEWIERLNQQRERQRAEAVETDRIQQAARHAEQLAHDRSLHRSTQRVAWIALVVATGSAGFAVWTYYHPRQGDTASPPTAQRTSPIPRSLQSPPISEPLAASPGDVLPPIPASPTIPETTPAPSPTQAEPKPPNR